MKSYEYEESGQPTQDCPAPWVLVPFPFSIWRVPGQNDLEINIPATSSARLVPIPGQTQPGSSSKSVETQAPPTPPPPQPTQSPPPKAPGWSGMTVIDAIKYLNGLYVVHVAEDSPAKKAGLLAGDQITSIITVHQKQCDPKSMQELRDCVKGVYPYSTYALVIDRHHKVLTFIISQTEKPANYQEQVIPEEDRDLFETF